MVKGLFFLWPNCNFELTGENESRKSYFFVSIELLLEISTVKRFRVRGRGGGDEGGGQWKCFSNKLT